MQKTNVVYKINCKNCVYSYVGHTKRALQKRITEHKKHYNCNSVVSIHENKNHKFNWENIIIFDNEPVYYKRLISEMLFIKYTENTINKQEDTHLLSHLYNTFLNSTKIINSRTPRN